MSHEDFHEINEKRKVLGNCNWGDGLGLGLFFSSSLMSSFKELDSSCGLVIIFM